MGRGIKNKYRVFLGVLLSLVSLVSSLLIQSSVQAANPGDIVINEIMYHASSDLDNDDYVELYNTTNDTISLDGWCFTQGITLCFTSEHSIDAHDYIVVSRDTSQTQSTYGVTPLALYTGNLSNGGETVELQDNSSNVIDTVTYADSPPWPTTPDGDGPSLELKDYELDNSQSENWGASNPDPTPGEENSLYGLELPSISNVSDPNNINENEAVTITAEVNDAEEVNLVYKVMFGDDETVQMYDDGNHGDGGNNDGMYGAQIPGQTAGQLVRFRIDAENEDGTASSPSADQSINYHGYVIQDPSVASNAPILQWFIDEDDYQTMHDNLNTVDRYQAIIAYDNDVYDNGEVRLKGNNTLYMPKKGYKFYLPDGYTIQLPGAERATDEFHMNADYTSRNIAKVPTLWWAAKQTGLPTPDVITTRLQRNGSFEGAYNFIDKFEKQWREDTGFDDGQLFEDSGEIVDGADNFDDFNAWQNAMKQDSQTDEARDYILDNNNIPNLINFMTFPALVYHHDHAANHNTLQFRDNATQRWSLLHWDFDLALVDSLGPKTLIGIYDQWPGQYGYRWYINPVYDQPDLRQAYLRRLRTLTDQMYTQDGLKNKYIELTALYEDLSELDIQKWGTDMRRVKELDLAMIERQRTSLLIHLRTSWGVPEAQTDAQRQSISFGVVNSDVASANEYIRLDNSSDAAVDLSDWQVEGINYTLPKGSVVPGNSSIYLLRDDLGYRAAHPSVLVAGQYSQDLGLFGTLTLKTNAGQVIDSHAY